MTNYTTLMKSLLILLISVISSSLLTSLSAGNKKIEQPLSRSIVVKNDPDLIPIKVKIKIAPDKIYYHTGDKVSLCYEIYLNKSDPIYNQNQEYMVINDDDIATKTGSGWTILKSDLKEVSKLNSSKDKLTGSIFMVNNGSMWFNYNFTLFRISKKKSGVYQSKHNFYFDNAFTIKIKSKSYEETDYQGKKLDRKIKDKIDYLNSTNIIKQIENPKYKIPNFSQRNAKTDPIEWTADESHILKDTQYTYDNYTDANAFSLHCYNSMGFEIFNHGCNIDTSVNGEITFEAGPIICDAVIDYYVTSYHCTKTIHIIDSFPINGRITYKSLDLVATQSTNHNVFIDKPVIGKVLLYRLVNESEPHNATFMQELDLINGYYSFPAISYPYFSLSVRTELGEVYAVSHYYTLDDPNTPRFDCFWNGFEFFHPEVAIAFWGTHLNQLNISVEYESDNYVNIDETTSTFSVGSMLFCTGEDMLQQTLIYKTTSILSGCNFHPISVYIGQNNTQQWDNCFLEDQYSPWSVMDTDRVILNGYQHPAENGNYTWTVYPSIRNISVLYHELSHWFLHCKGMLQEDGFHIWSGYSDDFDMLFSESFADFTGVIARQSNTTSMNLNMSGGLISFSNKTYCLNSNLSTVVTTDLSTGAVIINGDLQNYGTYNPPDAICIEREMDVTQLLWDIYDSSNEDSPTFQDQISLPYSTMLNNGLLLPDNLILTHPVILKYLNKLCKNTQNHEYENSLENLAVNHNIPFSCTRGREFHIKLDGTGDFRTIKEAVDSDEVRDDDILLVGPGYYHDGLIYTNKVLDIVGESPNSTFITYSNDNMYFMINSYFPGRLNLRNITFDGIDFDPMQNPELFGLLLGNGGSIDNCTFKNLDEGIHMCYMPYSSVSNCRFYENRSWGIKENSENGKNAPEFNTISNCLFYRNGYLQNAGNGGAFQVENLYINNCTIIDNYIALGGTCNNVNNSIIRNNDIFEINNGNNTGNQFFYCDIDGSIPGNGNIMDDPQFVNPEENDYSLRFDGVLRNPCVDTGNPDLDGDGVMWYEDEDDQDSDGSQMDMGAIPLIDGHVHGAHVLKGGQVAWISFPGVINPDPSNPEHSSSYRYIFDEFRDNLLLNFQGEPIVQRIDCKTNNDNIIITPNQLTPELADHTYICSQYGYKIQLLNPSPAFSKVMEYQGYRPGDIYNDGMYAHELGRNTNAMFIKGVPRWNEPSDVNCTSNIYSGSWQREIYLGYYLPESMNPFDALGPILSNVVAIYAKDWSYMRIPVYDGDQTHPDEPWLDFTNNWLGRVSSNEEPTINPGDMIVIKYIGRNDVEFKWGGENPDPFFRPSHSRDMATHFGYREDPEYLPIFIDFDLSQYEEGLKPVEIAIFVDNECKGAAVIKDGQVQLNAYICADKDYALAHMQFQMWFPYRNQTQSVNNYYIMNDNGRYELRNATVNDCNELLRVAFSPSNNTQTPMISALRGNYPNPFNPETIIKYDIAKSGKTRIDIYNIKGQLVKTLLDKQVDAGSYEIKWDGRNNEGRVTSSGVYFYKMRTNGYNCISKMLMLK